MRKLIPFLARFGKLAVQKGLSIGLGFITLMILTSSLSPTEMGAYFALVSAAGILATPFNGALGPFMLGETARMGRDDAQLNALVRKVLIVIAGYVLALAVVSPLLLRFFGTNAAQFSGIVPLLVLTLSLTALTSNTLLGTGRVALSQVGDNVVRPAVFVSAVAALSHWSALSTLTALAAVVLAQGSAVLVSGSIFVSRQRAPAQAPSALGFPLLLRYAKHFLNAVAWSLHANLPTIIVASFALSSTADFALSQKIVALLAVAGSLISIANSKSYADMAAAGHRAEAYRYFTRMLASSACILLPPVLIWLLVDDQVIRSAFGQQYVNGVSAVVLILLPAHLTFSLLSPVLPFLYGLNLQHAVFYLQLCALALLVGLGLWLAPKYGAEGMAISYTVSQVALYLSVFWLFYRETRGTTS
jgi:O-antigen/teichoic acid export membrane protein